MGKTRLGKAKRYLLLQLPSRLVEDHNVKFGSIVQDSDEDSYPPFILNISCILYVIPNSYLQPHSDYRDLSCFLAIHIKQMSRSHEKEMYLQDNYEIHAEPPPRTKLLKIL